MLFHLLSWLVLISAGAIIGNAILLLTNNSTLAHSGDRLVVATWLGLLLMGSVLLGLSVAMPLTLTVGLAVMVGLTLVSAIIYAVSGARMLTVHCPTVGVGLSIILLSGVVALNSTRIIEAYDTGLYHYQFVRWLSQYGTVPGFALLQERFGSSSSWFALASPFDFGSFQGRVGGLLGGLALLLCLFHVAIALRRVLAGRGALPDWFVIGGYALIVPVCLAWSFEVSLSPDLPAWILVLLTGWAMLLVGERRPANEDYTEDLGRNAILPLILAVGAVAVKLSAAPMVLVTTIFYFHKSREKWGAKALSFCGAGLMAIPLLLANVVSTGCPLYPNSLGCLDVPWAVGKSAAKQCARDVTEWARWSGPTPPGATAWNWILPWFRHLDKGLLVIFCVTCLLLFVTTRQWSKNRSLAYVFSLSVLGLVFIFVTAPNPRFGAGYLALCPALCAAAIGPNLARRPVPSKNARMLNFAVLIVMMAIVVALYATVRELRVHRSVTRSHRPELEDYSVRRRLLEPPRVAHSSGDAAFVSNRRANEIGTLHVSSEQYHGIQYWLTVDGGDQCWGVAIPCLPTPLEGNVYLRNPAVGLRGGFSRFPNSR